MTWELIKSASSKSARLYRMNVPNGWLLRSASTAIKKIHRLEAQNVSTSETLLFILDNEHTWCLDETTTWETLKFNYKDFFGALIDTTSRLKVPNGWVVKTHSGNKARSTIGSTVSEAMTFVPDPKHVWFIEEVV
ncbi:MAG: hypothetical protein HQL46_15355 [Gammaproteobacteria bacterium]|nr:hypothetical protein [Gammaproteobacteria bacterium]